MKLLTLLLVVGFLGRSICFAQLDQMGTMGGDFRVNDRPGTAPTVGLPGGPSLSPEPTLFRDFAGTRSPDEVLKSLDKELGKNPSADSDPSARDTPMGLEQVLRATPDQVFK
ncbi:MAG TPA: hypothetical protein VH681_13725 [Nitrospiraceae bacterium]|jgi:hypothetical protein